MGKGREGEVIKGRGGKRARGEEEQAGKGRGGKWGRGKQEGEGETGGGVSRGGGRAWAHPVGMCG